MAEDRKHGEPAQFRALQEMTRGLAVEGRTADGPDSAQAERDLKGRDVLAADGTRIGEVERVLVDSAAPHERFLEVGIAGHLSAGNEGRQVLIPMSETRVAEDGERILLQRLRGEDINNLPPYVRDEVPADYDVRFRDRVGNRFGAEPIMEQGFLGQQED